MTMTDRSAQRSSRTLSLSLPSIAGRTLLLFAIGFALMQIAVMAFHLA